MTPLAGAGGVRKSLTIAIDGCRPDALLAADCPNIDSLIASGAFSGDAQCEDLTFSGPNWSTILHGVHRDKHRVTTNDYAGNDLANWPDYFHYLEQHNPAWNTYRVLTWLVAHSNQPTGADVAINREYSANGDALAALDVVRLLRGTHPTYTADPDAIFIFFSDVDTAGHTYGFDPSRPGYLAEIEDTDALIGQILDALYDRPGYANEDWLIVLTSDHGGNIDGTHHGGTPERRRIPFLVSGPSAVVGTPFPQPKNVDV
ncbi:MAG: alkaline phosphatase family protein, partial [Dongiaceae bacterium]